MTWSDPSTRSTGDLITAAIWNQDVVDNGQYLHDRVLPIWIPSHYTFPGLGDYASDAGGGFTSRLSAYIPDNFDTLVSATIVIGSNVTTTLNYNLNSDYAQPDTSENYDNHSESLTGQTLSVTANRVYEIDISGVLTYLAAGDVLGVKIDKNSGTNDQKVLGMLLLITLI